MNIGDIVKGKAYWPRGHKRGEKVEFETVIGTLASPPGDVLADRSMAWIVDKTGEFRAVYESTLELVIGQLSDEPDPTPTVRARVLDEAKRITAKDRNSAYGEPEDNFQRIADLWNVFLQDKLAINLTPGDTAALMILVKVAREMNAASEDNKVDIAGYAACWAQVDANKK